MSYVVMKAEDVRNLALTKQEKLLTERDNRMREALDDTRSEMTESFFHKLFRRPEPTDSEVRAYMHRDFANSIHAPDVWIPHYYEKTLASIERILNATKYADEIHLSTSDLNLISP